MFLIQGTENFSHYNKFIIISKENTVLRAALDPHMVSVIPNAIVAENFRPDSSKASKDTSNFN